MDGGGDCLELITLSARRELSRWYYARFGRVSSRQRRIGIVALARKLLVQLWKYLETSVPPAGAQLADWRTKTRITSANLSIG